MLKIGLLGAGRIGQVHAKAINAHPQSQLTVVADIIEPNAKTLADQYGSSVGSIDSILADANIDAVLIATSTDTHCDLIEAATAAGKAVLCEKPVDLSLERARECLKKANATGQPIMMGFNRRFDNNFASLKAAADAGEIGKLELLSIASFDPAPPPIDYINVSGGLYRDMMIHDFDMANFIMGEPPVSISAVGTSIVDSKIGDAGDVDTAVATLQYADGRIAVIRNSRRAAYGYDQRVELLGSRGQLEVQNQLESTVVKSTEDGVVSAKPTYFFLERYMPAYEIEWAAFVDAINGNSKIPATLEDGITALAMAEAATRSSQSGLAVQLSDV